MSRRGGIAGLVAAIGLSATIAASPRAEAETLTDALIMAYRHSGLLEKNRAVLRAADEDVAQAIATLRPIVSYSVQAQRTYVYANSGTIQTSPLAPAQRVSGDDIFDTANIGVTAELLLYDGGANRLAIDAAKELVLATRERLVSVEQQVLLNAVSAYLQVRDAEAFVNLRRSNLELISRELQAAEDRFEVGEVTRTDVALAEARLAEIRSELAAALGELELARAAYVDAVGQAPGNLVDPGNMPPQVDTLDAAQAVSQRTFPDIKRDMRLITVAELNVDRAEAAVRPRVVGRGALSIDEDYTESATLSLEMTGPIYRGGQLTSAYRQAVARRDESRADLHVTVHSTLQQVASAWARLAVARSRISSSQEEIRAATVAFRGLQEEAKLGARTTLDVLNAEQDLQDARAGLITARTSEMLAEYQLLAAMGLMTVDHLNLGIVTYDPSAYYNAVRDAPTHKVSPRGEKLDTLLRSLGRN